MTLLIPDLDLPAPEDIDNIIFVRIPKTGSTSMMSLKTEKWEGASKRHVDYRVWSKWRDSNKVTLSFTIVRNPFAMLASQYQHRRRKKAVSASFKEFIKAVSMDHSFNRRAKNAHLQGHAFIEKKSAQNLQTLNLGISSRNQMIFNQIRTKSLFYQAFNRDGECKVGFILKLENISSCTDFLNKYICNNIKSFPSKNVYFNQEDYKNHYTDDMIKLVENYYGNDLKMFGYNFDGSLDDRAIIDPKTVSIQPFDWDELFHTLENSPRRVRRRKKRRSPPSVNGAVKQSSKKNARYIMVNGRKMKA